MTDATPSSPKRVPIQERSLSIRNVIGINGYRVNHSALQQRFIEGGYSVHATTHFLVFTRAEAPSLLLVHWFAPTALNANVGDWLVQELKPLGIVRSEQDFGAIFGVLIGSLFPHEVQRAWRIYASNTLTCYQQLLAGNATDTQSTIGVFATLYHRVFSLLVGTRFLDAGCSFGFLPLLVAERFSDVTHAVGIDIETSSFVTTRWLATELHLDGVQFIQTDLLAKDVEHVGRFDTVTALHVLEHFTEEEMYVVLKNLLRVTIQRLIIAVPYEQDIPEAIYGHKQLFSRAKLEAVGHWCLQQWSGEGTVWYEKSADGLLVIQRSPVPDNLC